MTRSIIIFHFLLLNCMALQAQDTLYDFVKLGKYDVGYKDTIVFDKSLQYQAYDYKGYKPSFIQIWHPITQNSRNQKFMTFQDFFKQEKKAKLTEMHKHLEKHYRQAFIRDCIEENLATGNANNFEKCSYDSILNLIGDLETRSYYTSDIKPNGFPIIIYHHGSQSFSFENHAMAEYFASLGFIFIAANFHLPFENTTYGLKPYNMIIQGEEEQSLKAILNFSKTLSSSNKIFFIGHSWGAQMGLRTFGGDSTLKALISLETTIEFKTDHERIKEMWPEVFQKVITENVRYPFPLLLCAATGKEKPFDFFKNLNAPRVIYAPTNGEFEHNAYVSAFYLRLFVDHIVEQPDKEILKDSLLLYIEHLEMINEFIAEILANKIIPNNEIRYVKHK